ncbi:hypothetical protein OL239_11735 [Arthrobacter sp. ATA002]|uniref:hypothetical protein n=1 Tax=Arthrobacter sp. ATA002 TaxID=2991715 RepID=UPI0022A69BCA|nr:hypothetical protein [Arthrobacter sp. ATA002]WAP50695.1 hypothetical protein OL239_11735 [Arthrobacter sp. ATA002]
MNVQPVHNPASSKSQSGGSASGAGKARPPEYRLVSTDQVGTAGTGSGTSEPHRRCNTLVAAVKQAAQDMSGKKTLIDVEHVARQLEERIQYYWGADHGIGTDELRATARDIISSRPITGRHA